MPSPLAFQSAPASFREGVDVFGDAERNQPTRVEVQVSACLSFADLLGLLAFTPSVLVEYSELDDDDEIRFGVRYALLNTDLLTLERYASDAMAALEGTLTGQHVPPASYMRALATAITRVFGVAA